MSSGELYKADSEVELLNQLSVTQPQLLQQQHSQQAGKWSPTLPPSSLSHGVDESTSSPQAVDGALMMMQDKNIHEILTMNWSQVLKVHQVAEHFKSLSHHVKAGNGMSIGANLNYLMDNVVSNANFDFASVISKMIELDPSCVTNKSERDNKVPLYVALDDPGCPEKMLALIKPSAAFGRRKGGGAGGLLAEIVDSREYSGKNYLPLHVAILKNHTLEVIEQLVLAYPESVKIPDSDKKLPLHLAIDHDKHVDITRFLIYSTDDLLNTPDRDLNTPLHLLGKKVNDLRDSYESSKMDMGCLKIPELNSLIYLCIVLGSSVETLNDSGCNFFHCYFGDDYERAIDHSTVDSNTDNGKTDTIDALIRDRPWSCILHNTDMLKRSVEPLVILNRKMGKLLTYLEKKMELQDTSVLFLLLNFHLSVKAAALTHDSEQRRLNGVAQKIEDCIVNVFNCRSFDEPHKVLMMLLSKDSEKRRELLASRGDPQLVLRYSDNRTKLLFKCECLRESNFLGSCLEANVKGAFACPQVSRIINDVMMGHLGVQYQQSKVEGFHNTYMMFCPIFFSPALNKWLIDNPMQERRWCAFSQTTLKNIMWYSINLRSCPLAMLLLEGLSKCFAFVLVAYNAVHEANHRFEGSRDLSPIQIVLIVHLVADILYEVGQAEEEKWKMLKHFMGEWNSFDTVYIILTSIWAISLWVNGGNITSDNVDRQLDVGNV